MGFEEKPVFDVFMFVCGIVCSCIPRRDEAAVQTMRIRTLLKTLMKTRRMLSPSQQWCPQVPSSAHRPLVLPCESAGVMVTIFLVFFIASSFLHC